MKVINIFARINPMIAAKKDVSLEREIEISCLKQNIDYQRDVEKLFGNPLNFSKRKYYFNHMRLKAIKILLVILLVIFGFFMYISSGNETYFIFTYSIFVAIFLSIVTIAVGYSDFQKEQYNYYYGAFIQLIDDYTIQYEKKDQSLKFEKEAATTNE